MEKIRVNASKQYDIYIGGGALGTLSGLLGEKKRRYAVITDDNVERYHLAALLAALGEAGEDAPVFVLAHGEKSKNMDSLAAILEFLAEKRITRSDMIIALGGGVVGDITGLAAAMFLRGVEFIQIPTTLVSCVDSSVGGKCAVDLRAGKNLAGVFAQPSLVVCDTSLLSTLPDSEFSCGMAEVIKYALGFDRELFGMTLGDVHGQIDSIVKRCVSIKRDVVEADEFDLGERKKLNLGHTLGHAVEKCSGYSIPHGAAVGMGLASITKAFLPEAFGEVSRALEHNGLEIRAPFSSAELAAAAMSDKKRSGGTISLVVPTGIGSCVLRDTPVGEIGEVFEKGAV